MPPTEQKPDSRLEAIVSLLEKSPTREEFLTSFEEVVKVVLQIKKEQSQFTEEMSKALSAVLQKIQSDHASSLAKLKAQVNDLFVSEQLKKISSDLSERVDAKLATVVDGNDGHTPTKAELTALITPLIPAPKKGKDANEDAIYNRIKKEVEASFKKEMDALKTTLESRQGTVGGVTNLRIQQAFKYILKIEAPVGDIDGVNLSYTLSQPIFAILSMSLNGETIAQLPNYTINGKTFTFSVALPSAYSGKDFEVKYV